MRSALQALSREESEEHVRRLREQLVIAEDTITNSASAERRRLDVLDNYEAYAEHFFPGQDPWTADGTLLYEQLSGFLEFSVSLTKGREESATRVKAKTVSFWNTILLSGVVERVEHPVAVTGILRGRKHDHSDGLPYRLRKFAGTSSTHTTWIGIHPTAHFTEEQKSMRCWLLTQAASFLFASTAQATIQLLVSFLTGVRPSSLAAYSKTSGYLQVRDVRIVQQRRFKYTVELTIDNIKKFNGALNKGIQHTWVFRPITKMQNATLDLGPHRLHLPELLIRLRQRSQLPNQYQNSSFGFVKDLNFPASTKAPSSTRTL
ncbi:hypothetical protein CF326_g3064 [Tilletia indica]|nr:hypothetical protein CF326_g3064 [Tilletia indica]